MKKALFLLLSLFFVCTSVAAFDWKPVENAQLYEDMITYTRAAADSLAGTAAEPVIRKFITKQEKIFEDDPYAWIGNTYKLVYELEKLYPPHPADGSIEAKARMHMFRILDYPIHNWCDGPKATQEEKIAWSLGRDNNRNQGCKRVLAELAKPAPAPGTLQVLKVYNMGYVLRTSERCFAIDICWHGSDGDAAKLAKYIDVMFVTHPHGDHYTPVMLEAVLKAGKKLVLSKDYGPVDKKGNKLVYWEDIIDTPVDICGIEMKTLKGHQDRNDPAQCPNNVYHLSFDGWTVIHDGDNDDRGKNVLLESMEAPDLVFYATWNRPYRVIDHIRNAKGLENHTPLFISSHENEYGHRVQQRESYWETYTRKDRYGDPDYKYFPWMTMESGESISLTHEYLNSLELQQN